jgi:hypothetical protein
VKTDRICTTEKPCCSKHCALEVTSPRDPLTDDKLRAACENSARAAGKAPWAHHGVAAPALPQCLLASKLVVHQLAAVSVGLRVLGMEVECCARCLAL